MKSKVYLAVDLGAESGRVMAGIWNDRTIALDEVHRFPNGPVAIAGSLRWDALRLWAEIQIGLAMAGKKYGRRIVSVGADTWGVDFVLLNKHEEMLGQPFHYRDARTRGMMAAAFKKAPRAEIFAQSGLQFMEINSLYQLMAWKAHSPQILDAARTLLFMPDFLHWAMSGTRKAEFTIASTSQFVHPRTRNWSKPLLKRLGLSTHFLPEIVAPGTTLGLLRKSVAERVGLPGVKVVAPPSHDTASAVAGVPARGGNWAYLSSGTWSLMGVETPSANLSPDALALNMTNEGGAGGTYRLLKNIMGLWLVQRCKAAFEARGRHYDYGELTDLAAKAKPWRSVVNPNDPRFLNPPDMAKEIQDACRETGQPAPRNPGEIIRCALESLALKYRDTLAALERLTGARLDAIHIVGGGSRNALLNRLTADACERTITTGPVEATALGNLLVQAQTDGELKDLSEIRAVVRASMRVREIDPRPNAGWRHAAERLSAMR